jgi:hypothetical protein
MTDPSRPVGPLLPNVPTITPAEFLTTIFAPVDSGYVSVSGKPHGNWRDDLKVVPCSAAATLATDQQERYFTLQPRKTEHRGDEANVLGVVALAIDFDSASSSSGKDPASSFGDISQVRQFLANTMPFPPSAIVDSGNGWHVYYFLLELLSPLEGKELLERFKQHLQSHATAQGKHLDSIFDLSRVMRIPGSINGKNGTPTFVVELHPIRRYDVGDFDFLPGLQASQNMKLNPPTTRITSAEVAEWIERLPEGDGGEDGIAEWCDRLRGAVPGSPNQGRHPTAISVIGLASKFALRGWVDFRQAISALEDVWEEVKSGETYEFQQIVHNVVGYRIAEARSERTTASASPTEVSEGPDISHLVPVDFATLSSDLSDQEQFLVEPILPARRSTAIVASAGLGKSLLALDMAASLATGRAVCDRPEGDPCHVVYIDMEMTYEDLAERLDDLGYDYSHDPNLQDRLHYYLMSDFAPFDTADGGNQLVGVVLRHSATAVIIDTLARVVKGKENDADTYRDFAHYTTRRLKQLHVAVLRLDHEGKKKNLGGRGSSAKRDDVDVEWRLSVDATGVVVLDLKKSRTRWVPPQPLTPAQKRLMETLDELGVSPDMGRKGAGDLVRAAGFKFSTNDFGPVKKARMTDARTNPPDHEDELGKNAGETARTGVSDQFGRLPGDNPDHGSPLEGDPGPSPAPGADSLRQATETETGSATWEELIERAAQARGS